MEKSAFNGIVKREDENFQVTSIPPSVGIYHSLLQVPLCVLHPTAAKKLDALELVRYKKDADGKIIATYRFSLRRDAGTPLPTTTHLKYLDIMICMFCQNWNKAGILRFRFGDILRIAGVKNSHGSRDAIKESILRYMRHPTEWENLWAEGVQRINFNLIRASSIINQDNQIKRGSETSNSRKSSDKDIWHSVTFNEPLVKALEEEQKNRIFSSELFSKLPTDSFYVYRFFKAGVDSNISEKLADANWRDMQTLLSVFKWTGQKGRFKKWLEDRIEVLVGFGLISSWTWNIHGNALKVVCKSQEELSKEKRSGLMVIETPANKPLNLNRCPDHELLALYYDYKSQNRIPEEECSAIDMLLTLKSMQKSALDIIRKTIISLHTVSD